jgi:biopolymer transport protein ExbD
MALHLSEGDDLQENHEINVTPFIDVMLVLLIIFMVAAPLATVDIKVDLPAASATPQVRPDKPLYLTVKDDHSLFIGEQATTREQLGQALDQQTQAYEELMEVMNARRGAGYLKIGLVGLEAVGKP